MLHLVNFIFHQLHVHTVPQKNGLRDKFDLGMAAFGTKLDEDASTGTASPKLVERFMQAKATMDRWKQIESEKSKGLATTEDVHQFLYSSNALLLVLSADVFDASFEISAGRPPFCHELEIDVRGTSTVYITPSKQICVEMELGEIKSGANHSDGWEQLLVRLAVLERVIVAVTSKSATSQSPSYRLKGRLHVTRPGKHPIPASEILGRYRRVIKFINEDSAYIVEDL